MNYKAKKLLIYTVKLGIVISALWFIYVEVFKNENFEAVQASISTTLNFNNSRFYYLIIVLLLMPLNWFLETKKWHYLIAKIHPLSFVNALKGVLSGLTFTALTPNRTGEFVGRIIYVDDTDKIQASLITILGSFAQLTITVVFGGINTLLFLNYYPYIEMDYFIVMLLNLLLFGLVVVTPILYFNTPLLSFLLNRIPFLKKYKKYVNTFELFHAKELIKTLVYSAMRYVVFSTQFVLLLYFFDVSIGLLDAVICVGLIFFTITIIPSSALYEIGIRESVAIYFIGFFTEQHIAIISSTLLLWLINVAIPAITGSYFVLTGKILKPKI